MSVTNLTSTVGQQLLNLWLLKVIHRCINDSVTTIKPGHQTTGNMRMIWSDESSFMLFLTSGRVYLQRTPKEAYKLECLVPTAKQRGDCVIIWAAVSWCNLLLVPLSHVIDGLLWGSTWKGWVIRYLSWSSRYFWTTMQFSKLTMPPFTQQEIFSHGLKNMKMNFNIFPGHYSHTFGHHWTTLVSFWD
jgi:hypothetical protein